MPPRMLRVLVIDDDPVVRDCAAEVLTDDGYVVIRAAGGGSGIEQALRSPPDLVLCDLLMPGVDGFGVLPACVPSRRRHTFPSSSSPRVPKSRMPGSATCSAPMNTSANRSPVTNFPRWSPAA